MSELTTLLAVAAVLTPTAVFAILLALHIVVPARHVEGYTRVTPQWVWFVADYFCFERVQLFTFDIIEERVGLKLIFGCLALYPVLYPVALWGTAGLPSPDIDPALNPLWLGGSAAVFLLGWVITRGANLQKYMFKRFPERPFLGFVKPVTVTDGERKILCSGF